MADHEDYQPGEAPAIHAPTHEDGGSDEISVAGLTGEVADDQPPKAHDLGGGKHNADSLANLNLKVNDATLDDSGDPRTPSAHKVSHQDGGADEISIAGLAGVSAELATHAGLATVHQNAPGLIETHRLISNAHHDKYTDADARAAINDIFGADGKADADIDLDGHDLKGGSVILPNGECIGIGAALERLEFYAAGYAAFMGCNVGIGTVSPVVPLHIIMNADAAGIRFERTSATAARYEQYIKPVGDFALDEAGVANRLLIQKATGIFTITNLAGAGSRAVMADANGVLSAP